MNNTQEYSYNHVTKVPLLTGIEEESKRKEIKEYLLDSFQINDNLFSLIKEDSSYYLRPEKLRHPLIFYFGHTAVFYINKLFNQNVIDERVDTNIESLCSVGVDEMSWDDLDQKNYNWPSVDEVRSYRKKVKRIVLRVINEMEISLPLKSDSVAWTILMGIEHARIHLETSSVIIRMMDLSLLNSSPLFPSCKEYGKSPINKLVDIKGDIISIGKKSDDQTYGWDNEFGTRELKIPSFKISKYLVSNEEFLEFVNNDGYQNKEYWDKEGKEWLSYTLTKHPIFWKIVNKSYYQRNLTEEIPLPLNWPCEVNYLEAKAFCNYKNITQDKNYRLPTEEEWLLLRNKIKSDQPHWENAPGNINLEYCASSTPVDMFETDGVYDILGNVWQWTETHFSSLDGFKVHPLYDDFSTPTFDGKHNLIKGGSWISTGNESLKSARFAFRRHFFQHAGFRYIESNYEVKQFTDIYETNSSLNQYINFHYGNEEYFNVKNFPKECITKLIIETGDGKKNKALDLGCSVGRSTFELANYFNHVDGIDFSANFISIGNFLLDGKNIKYEIVSEGELTTEKNIKLSDLDYTYSSTINFIQGDACNLKEIFTDYDLIFAGNLIDRLYDPKLFLNHIAKRINKGGYLVLTSPYTWLEEYTNKENWPGGLEANGKKITTLEGLKKNLSPTFTLTKTLDVPFVISETKRKFQHTIAEMSIWKKND